MRDAQHIGTHRPHVNLVPYVGLYRRTIRIPFRRIENGGWGPVIFNWKFNPNHAGQVPAPGPRTIHDDRTRNPSGRGFNGLYTAVGDADSGDRNTFHNRGTCLLRRTRQGTGRPYRIRKTTVRQEQA